LSYRPESSGLEENCLFLCFWVQVWWVLAGAQEGKTAAAAARSKSSESSRTSFSGVKLGDIWVEFLIVQEAVLCSDECDISRRFIFGDDEYQCCLLLLKPFCQSRC